MRHDLTNFIFFITKPYYTRNEVLIMISALLFLIMLYGTTIDFLFGIDNIPQEYLIKKMYLNWMYLVCGICVICYSKIIQNEEINKIDNKLNCIENNLYMYEE